MSIRDYTEFKHNAVGIDPAGCGCTDCIVGNSIPLDDFNLDELAKQAMAGRALNNRTGLPLVLDRSRMRIRVVPEGHPDRWRYGRGTVTHVVVFPEVEG